MTSSALGIAMQRAICGTLAMEDVARIVVSSAVDETIRAISFEYGLNAEKIKIDHLERIVSKYSTCDRGECAHTTTRGTACGRSVVYGSTCATHLKHIHDPPPQKHRHAQIHENAEWTQRVLAFIEDGRRVEDEPS